MEITLAIDTATCIRCGKCVRVCPSGIFTQQKPDGNTESRTTGTPAGNDQENTPASSSKNGFEIRIVNPETCIVCGHCVAACPTGSVEHERLPRRQSTQNRLRTTAHTRTGPAVVQSAPVEPRDHVQAHSARKTRPDSRSGTPGPHCEQLAVGIVHSGYRSEKATGSKRFYHPHLRQGPGQVSKTRCSNRY